MKYTLNVPDVLMQRLHDEHARTYAQHRQPFGPWLCDAWAIWLDQTIKQHLAKK